MKATEKRKLCLLDEAFKLKEKVAGMEQTLK